MLWNSKYKLGIQEVDDQHRQWLLITEKLLDALTDGSVKASIFSIFDDLFRYTQCHFKYEEDLLVANRYPHLEHHRALHRGLVRQLHSIRDRMVSKNYLKVDQTITNEMVDLVGLCQRWLVEHIEVEDKKCASFLTMPIQSQSEKTL